MKATGEDAGPWTIRKSTYGSRNMNKPSVPPMPIPLQVTSRGLKLPKTAETWVQAEVAKLETFYPRIMGCRVAVEKLHRHHRAGGLFHVRIDLTLPGGELVIKHEPTLISRAQKLGETAVRKHSEAGTPHKNLRHPRWGESPDC
jgi:hypothetical protein